MVCMNFKVHLYLCVCMRACMCVCVRARACVCRARERCNIKDIYVFWDSMSYLGLHVCVFLKVHDQQEADEKKATLQKIQEALCVQTQQIVEKCVYPWFVCECMCMRDYV